MKKRNLLICFTALCMLAGCSEQASDVTNDSITEADESSVISDTEENESTTTAAAESAASEGTTATEAEPLEPENVIMKYMDTVDVHEDIPLADFVIETNMELLDDAVLIDTSEIGEHTAVIPYIYEGNDFTQTVKYTVVDTTPPMLISGGWTVTQLCGTDFDLNNYVSFADNYDRTPQLSWTGDVDVDTVGTYTVAATLTDSSGNETCWNATVNVVDKLPSYEEEEIPRVDYSDFIAMHEGEGNVRFGIDVSKWQGDIDFDAVRDAGCSFVIIRIGSYYSEITQDEYFRQNLENAIAAGLDVGIYFYSTDKSVDTVRENAKWIAQQLDGQALDLPIVFDWEEFSHFQRHEMSIHDLNEVYAAFADELESCGYSVMLYSSKNYLNVFWDEKTKSSHPVWLAHYTDKTDYEGDYAIWQASAYGRIPGIYGDVDMDIQYLDMPME